MELRNEIYRLNKLHRLIKNHRTGSPQELAERLRISRRHLYNVMEDLRMLGAKIDYSRSNCTFYYTNDFELRLNLEVEYLDDNQKDVFLREIFRIMQCLCTEQPYLCNCKGIRYKQSTLLTVKTIRNEEFEQCLYG